MAVGFHHIRVHAPGATESATVRNDFSCMICSSPLKEDVKFRVLGGKNDAFWMSDTYDIYGYKRFTENVQCVLYVLCSACVHMCLWKQTNNWWSWSISKHWMLLVPINKTHWDTNLSPCFSEVGLHHTNGLYIAQTQDQSIILSSIIVSTSQHIDWLFKCI